MRKKNRNDPATLRGMLDGAHILQQWSRINSFLFSGYKPVYNEPTGPVADLTPSDFKVIGWEPLTPADVSRFTRMVDSYNRLLNKLLPELKAVDVSDVRAAASDALSSREKATRLYALLRASPEGARLLQALETAPTIPAPAPASETNALAPSPASASVPAPEIDEPWLH